MEYFAVKYITVKYDFYAFITVVNSRITYSWFNQNTMNLLITFAYARKLLRQSIKLKRLSE